MNRQPPVVVPRRKCIEEIFSIHIEKHSHTHYSLKDQWTEKGSSCLNRREMPEGSLKLLNVHTLFFLFIRVEDQVQHYDKRSSRSLQEGLKRKMYFQNKGLTKVRLVIFSSGQNQTRRALRIGNIENRAFPFFKTTTIFGWGQKSLE